MGWKGLAAEMQARKVPDLEAREMRRGAAQRVEAVTLVRAQPWGIAARDQAKAASPAAKPVLNAACNR